MPTVYQRARHAIMEMLQPGIHDRMHRLESSISLLRESSIGDVVELTLEDAEYRKLNREAEQHLSHRGLVSAGNMARWMYALNPLIKRGVETQCNYLFARSLSFDDTPSSPSPSPSFALTTFLEANTNTIGSHLGLWNQERDLQLYGNLFYVLFQEGPRRVPLNQVVDIVTNPDDATDAWFYYRKWNVGRESRAALYPDIKHKPTDDSATYVQSLYPTTEIRPTPIHHIKTGAVDDALYGFCDVFSACTWARAYKSFLEDWATVTRSLSTFAWKYINAGGQRGAEAVKTKLSTTLNSNNALDSNPPPLKGGVAILTGGSDMEPIRANGAAVSPSDGRHIKLMVCANFGLPETFFGDVSVGTLATAASLDRPTELMFQVRQEFWSDHLHAMLLNYNFDVRPKFPPIIQRDTLQSIQALTQAAAAPAPTTIDKETLVREVCSILGLSDPDAIWSKVQAQDKASEGEAGDLNRALDRLTGQQP